ncbi:MAG: hypothetical protein WC405_08300 [Syntrophales bacterium]
MKKDLVCQEELDHKIRGAVSVFISGSKAGLFLRPHHSRLLLRRIQGVRSLPVEILYEPLQACVAGGDNLIIDKMAILTIDRPIVFRK